jgi:hypothetical protein
MRTMLGDTLSDADDKGNLSLDGLLDTGGGNGRAILSLAVVMIRLNLRSLRDENSRSRGASLFNGLGDILEDGQVQMGRAGLLGVGAANNLGS